MTKGQNNYLISLIVIAVMVIIGMLGGYFYIQKHHSSWLVKEEVNVATASTPVAETAPLAASNTSGNTNASEASNNAPASTTEPIAQTTVQKTTFPLKPNPTAVLVGMCRMDVCPYAKVTDLQALGNTNDSTTVRAKILSGTSEHPGGDYPVGIPNNIVWDNSSDDAIVVCSFKNPTITWHDQITVLNFNEVASAWEMDANVYFAVCHNFYDGYAEGATKFYYFNS